MSLQDSQEYASGCWISDYQYEGPGTTPHGNEFMVHATLEPGAEQYFSGIRVIIGCKNTQELAILEIDDNVGSRAQHRHPLGAGRAKADETTSSMLEAQQRGCRLAKQWTKSDSDTISDLPLCTLVFEVVDKSTSTWALAHLTLHPPQTTESLSLRTLYDCVQLCTPTLRSCVLFLKVNHTFRGSPRKDKYGYTLAYPASMGILAHGVRILPPSSSRLPFNNLPVELLHMIFREAIQEFRSCWRRTLISFALVCHAWIPALEHLVRDFAHYNGGRNCPTPMRVARAIESNPQLGKKIRVFDSRHFPSAAEDVREFGKAIVTILQHATMLTDLYLGYTHRSCAHDLVRALCSLANVKRFRSGFGGFIPASGSSHFYTLSIDDILQCVSHWPRLCSLTVHGFDSTSDVHDSPTPTCSLEKLTLVYGSLKIQQLRMFTISSWSTLQDVKIEQIFGLANEDLRTWLIDVSTALTHLTIKRSPLSRRSDEEEYAVDMAVPKMPHLRHLELEGNIFSDAVLVRYAPYGTMQQPSRRKLTIDNAPQVNGRAFVNALRTTEWTQIRARHILYNERECAELSKTAHTIAQDRNISLAV